MLNTIIALVVLAIALALYGKWRERHTEAFMESGGAMILAICCFAVAVVLMAGMGLYHLFTS